MAGEGGVLGLENVGAELAGESGLGGKGEEGWRVWHLETTQCTMYQGFFGGLSSALCQLYCTPYV